MKSWKLICCLVSLGLVALVFGTYAYGKYAHQTAKDHLKLITSRGQKAVTQDVMFRNLAFCLAEGEPGEKLVVTEESILHSDQGFQKLKDRIRWISNDPEIDSKSTITFHNQNSDKKMYFFVVYGVRTMKVTDPFGKTKLYALQPVSGGYGNSSERASKDVPVPLGLINAKREDFANPEDIDWMFAMNDFTEDRSNIKHWNDNGGAQFRFGHR